MIRPLCLAALILITGRNVNAEQYGPDNLPPFVHPPILAPIPDGINPDIPKQLGNQPLAKLGLLDVTAVPFRADRTGKRDSTRAIQQAIDFARDAQMVCFFPSGTYVVHDTLVLRHGIHMRSHRATFMNNRQMPCVLIGSRQGEGTTGYSRPRIVLCDNAPGFDAPDHRKYVIEHRQYEVKKFTVRKNKAGGGASLMNTMFVNIDILLGRGNPGAAGMHIRSCEGSAVQDVMIDATHGHTGIAGATGNGGSWANVIVVGGRLGLDMRGWTPPTPTMEGITLIGQTEAAIVYSCRGPLTIVGLKIESHIPGPVIIGRETRGPFDGGVNIVDSQILFDRKYMHGQTVTAIASKRSIYMNNVYVRGADTVVTGALAGNRDCWVHIKEFAKGRAMRQRGYDLSLPVYVNGKKSQQPLIDLETGAKPPSDLQSRHVWNQRFPSWESSNVANVKSAPYNARGDSYADDTDALQRAIDENEVVFLPKGYYRVTKTIRLRPNTKLLGVAQHLSIIMARDPSGWFGSSDKPMPLVETADDSSAQTVIAFLGIRFPLEVDRSFQGATSPIYALKWRCGRESVFRSNDVHPLRVFGFKGSKKHRIPAQKHPSILITSHGGGKWYNYHTGQFFTPTVPAQRAILIDGTDEPIGFYNFEPQGGDGDAVAEIRNSRFVSLYGCKTECDTTFLRVVESDHIRVFGHGGIGNARPGGSLYVFERTPNFLIANLADQVNLKADRPYYGSHSVNRNIETYYPLIDLTASHQRRKVPPTERPVLYKVGSPRESPNETP